MPWIFMQLKSSNILFSDGACTVIRVGTDEEQFRESVQNPTTEVIKYFVMATLYTFKHCKRKVHNNPYFFYDTFFLHFASM